MSKCMECGTAKLPAGRIRCVQCVSRGGERSPDPVNHPAHYTQLGTEVIDIIEAALTPEQFEGYCLGNALKYRLRADHKGHAEQDRAKADWYDRRRLGVTE